MAASKSSLKDFLADLEKPGDFEAADELPALPQRDIEGATDHYVDTEKSALRNALPDQLLYQGRKVSRAELEKSPSPDQDLDGSDEEEEEEEEEVLPFGPVQSEEGEDEGEDTDGSEDAEEALANTQRHTKDMLEQLKQARGADVQKGQAVRKQLAFYDSLLEMRIKLQQALTEVRHVEDNAPKMPEDSEDVEMPLPPDRSQLLGRLGVLSEQLFQLREEVATSNQSAEPPARKRRKLDDESPLDVEQAWTQLEAFNEASEPFLQSTITKWSDKVTAASLTSLKTSKQFNSNSSLNKNTWEQIQHVLGSDGSRLLDRTRVPREKEEKERIVDPEVFDDADFFQGLLKDAVENQLLDLDDPSLAAFKKAAQGKNKSKKPTDNYASKDRRLKYTVHEKLQNFMVPIPCALWHEQQVAELFSSLLGKSIETTAASEVSGADVAPLRIFG